MQTIFQSPGQIALPHVRRIDRIVCQMHADRLRLLALEADAGYPARSVCPVRVVITPRRSLVQRALAWVRGVK